jgi:GrpB-like predicted nucleotidyltransferase (UPF0157 family)
MKTTHIKAFKALKSQHVNLNHEPVEQVFKRMLQVKAPELSLNLLTFQPRWHHEFCLEKDRLVSCLAHVFNVFHIGSTSIQNMASKNVIDMLLVVDCSPQKETLLAQLAELGYENYGVSPISGNAIWCWYILDHVSYVVHICHSSDPCIELPVAFSQFMNENKQAQRDYVAQKNKLLSSGQDLLAYSVSKVGIYCHFYEMAGDWKAKQPGGLALARYEKPNR